jgi:glycosyltransferase involved in cell wall biosynthesis
VVVLRQFARYQVRDGDTLQVVSFDDPASSWAQDFEYPLLALGPCSTFYGYTVKLVPWLRAHAGEYDVVIVHGIWQYHSLAVRCALAGAAVPYVVYTHGMLDPGHHKVSRWKQLKKQLYWWLAEARVLRDAATVFFTTEEERRIAPKGVWPVSWRRSDIVPYGVEAPTSEMDAQRELFLQRFPALRGRRVLLFLGRFDPKKGGRILMRALERGLADHPEVTLVMVGPDDIAEAQILRDRVPEAMRARVVWTGMLLGEEKWGAFRTAEAFIIPSHTENYCIAAVEALACGLPVLMSDKVNIHPQVTAHRAGYVEGDDVAGSVRLMQRWLATPSEEWLAMRARAADCYEAEFRMADAYRCYREALEHVVQNKFEAELTPPAAGVTVQSKSKV